MSEFWDLVAHLKDVASILTPIAITIFGLYINNSIQTQNKIAERRSALSKQWADGFSKLSEEVYDVTLRIMLLFFQAAHAEHFVIGDKEKFSADMRLENLNIALRLEEQRFRLATYSDLTPHSGAALTLAFESLKAEVRSWLESGGGNVDKLRELQIDFIQAVRVSHREMLDLSQS